MRIKPMISVLTCTYNRETYLPTLYKSLISQTSYDFEWIIVDDGSQDNTRRLVEEFINAEERFDIHYYYKENGGKHSAINEGMKYIASDWVFCVDSDDELTADAIETIKQWIDCLEKDAEADGFAAVSGLRGYRGGGIMGGFPKLKTEQQYIDAKNNERYKWHLGGDKAEVYRTSILKQYPFPVFENENFLAEGAVHNKIAVDGYKIRWFPKVIYMCDYLEDGLTRDDKKYINNFKGFTYSTKVSLEAYNGIRSLRPIAKYIQYARIKKVPRKNIVAELNISTGEYFAGTFLYFLYCVVKHKNWKRS